MYGDDLMKGNLPQSNDAVDQRCCKNQIQFVKSSLLKKETLLVKKWDRLPEQSVIEWNIYNIPMERLG